MVSQIGAKQSLTWKKWVWKNPLKKKFGLKYLYCERFPNEKLQEMGEKQFGYSEIPIETVSLQSLTVGELMGILRHNDDVDRAAVMEAKKV